jgi:RNA polymerase sigma-70 factor (ECF subfamily)
MDDKRIIELYFARDERAIEETRAKYGALLMKIAHGILSDEGDCEECQNDAYIRAWNSIPPERPERLSAFVARITRNLALNRARANRRRESYELRAIREELSSVGVSELCDELELRETLRSFVAGLDMARRRVFVQRYFYMMSVHRIASEQGISVGSVKSILSRTRAKLYLYLTERGFTV